MENKPKQTTVEWIYAKLETLRGELNYGVIDYEMYKIEKTRIYREALHREKNQIMQAYTLGHVFHDSNDENAAEFYYNTEYGKTSNN
jgi:hypothetical protein